MIIVFRIIWVGNPTRIWWGIAFLSEITLDYINWREEHTAWKPPTWEQHGRSHRRPAVSTSHRPPGYLYLHPEGTRLWFHPSLASPLAGHRVPITVLWFATQRRWSTSESIATTETTLGQGKKTCFNKKFETQIVQQKSVEKRTLVSSNWWKPWPSTLVVHYHPTISIQPSHFAGLAGLPCWANLGYPWVTAIDYLSFSRQYQPLASKNVAMSFTRTMIKSTDHDYNFQPWQWQWRAQPRTMVASSGSDDETWSRHWSWRSMSWWHTETGWATKTSVNQQRNQRNLYSTDR